ncbi:MAG: hypothetical protein AAF849_09830 [Bacteroidota bacterium]
MYHSLTIFSSFISAQIGNMLGEQRDILMLEVLGDYLRLSVDGYLE